MVLANAFLTNGFPGKWAFWQISFLANGIRYFEILDSLIRYYGFLEYGGSPNIDSRPITILPKFIIELSM